jgi:hypothetical protein
VALSLENDIHSMRLCLFHPAQETIEVVNDEVSCPVDCWGGAAGRHPGCIRAVPHRLRLTPAPVASVDPGEFVPDTGRRKDATRDADAGLTGSKCRFVDIRLTQAGPHLTKSNLYCHTQISCIYHCYRLSLRRCSGAEAVMPCVNLSRNFGHRKAGNACWDNLYEYRGFRD